MQKGSGWSWVCRYKPLPLKFPLHRSGSPEVHVSQCSLLRFKGGVRFLLFGDEPPPLHTFLFLDYNSILNPVIISFMQVAVNQRAVSRGFHQVREGEGRQVVCPVSLWSEEEIIEFHHPEGQGSSGFLTLGRLGKLQFGDRFTDFDHYLSSRQP